jgi:hypothetical protein
MKKSDVFCWVVVGLLLVFLWHSSSVEFFQDTPGIRGPPYTASDATKIVNVMPAAMKTALKASVRSDDPAQIIQPITPLMSDFHAVYAAATVPLTSANVDTFLQTEPIPTGLTKADVKTLLIAYFVTPTPGAANAPLTAGQITANAQQLVAGATSSSNAAAYAQLLGAVGQTGGYLSGPGGVSTTPPTPPGPSGPTGSTSPSGPTGSTSPTGGTTLLAPTGVYSMFGTPSSNAGTPFSGMQVGGPRYGGQGSYTSATTSGNWSSVGSNYPTMYGPRANNASLPNPNAGMILPTAQQAGADGNTVYMPGCRAPGQLGAFTPTLPQKTNADPSGFLPDYRVFMK